MNLRQYLTSRNMRQVAFVKASGLSPSLISKLCNDKYQPRISVDVIRKIYDATGGVVTANDLLGLRGHGSETVQ